jgi:hypothetical protein
MNILLNALNAVLAFFKGDFPQMASVAAKVAVADWDKLLAALDEEGHEVVQSAVNSATHASLQGDQVTVQLAAGDLAHLRGVAAMLTADAASPPDPAAAAAAAAALPPAPGIAVIAPPPVPVLQVPAPVPPVTVLVDPVPPPAPPLAKPLDPPVLVYPEPVIVEKAGIATPLKPLGTEPAAAPEPAPLEPIEPIEPFV